MKSSTNRIVQVDAERRLARDGQWLGVVVVVALCKLIRRRRVVIVGEVEAPATILATFKDLL